MRRLLTAALTIMLFTTGMSTVALARGGEATTRTRQAKVDVCHYDADSGMFHLINISANALQKHIDHGDAVPGDQVPGTPGSVFDSRCVPQAPVREVLVEVTDQGPTTGPPIGQAPAALAQSFEAPAINGILEVTLSVVKTDAPNEPSDGVVVTLHPDNAGVPNLTVELASSAPVPSSAIQSFSDGYSPTTFVLDGVNVPAGTYWVVVARTAALDGLRYYIVQLRYDNPYLNGEVFVIQGDGTGWISAADDLVITITSVS